MNPLEENVSKNRLGGEPCPSDLAFLIQEGSEFLELMGITINGEVGWESWNDKSYLSEDDLRDPDIAANVKAIDDTFRHICFVAETEEREYLGYWRSIENRSISESPMVCYSNEGQFLLCGNRLIEALFFHIDDDVLLEEFRGFAVQHGVELAFQSIDDIKQVTTAMTPDAYHLQQYENYTH